MKILALETTEALGTVAALRDVEPLYELTLNPQQRSAQSLAPGVKAVLEEVGWKPSEVELVAVSVGPGSFTGLRVGVTTAKTFAYSVGAEILGVDTLEVIAAQAPRESASLWAVMDAQRGQVVARLFHRGCDDRLVPTGPSELMDVQAWLERLAPGTAATGPILRKLAGRLPAYVAVVPSEYWNPTAATVGILAAHDYAMGRRNDVWGLVPHYFRISAAEEKWRERSKKG